MFKSAEGWFIPYFLIFLAYLALVRALRFRRSWTLPEQYGVRRREDLAKMTADDAQAILKDLIELEFPKFMGFSIVFALFKTYSLPSISSLLVTTGELSSRKTASKRMADTSVLLLEFSLNKPSSERAVKAIARMNYLHAPYIRAGKISNADMLYTLSVLALEPMRWINKHEWRQFTEFELCAAGTYWRAIGDAMDISFDELRSYNTGWRDGLQWLQEIERWSLQYEKEHMMPATVNSQLASAHLDVLFIDVPQQLNRIGKNIVAILLGEQLRIAMNFEKPPAWYYYTLHTLLAVRRFVLRHLCLPRPEFLRKHYISAEPDPKTGRFGLKEYLSHPWYVKPTFKQRWRLRAWLTWPLGRKLPGDDGDRYNPAGYLISEVGPARKRGHGLLHMKATEERLMVPEKGSCPFTVSKT